MLVNFQNKLKISTYSYTHRYVYVPLEYLKLRNIKLYGTIHWDKDYILAT